jgi:putative transposase
MTIAQREQQILRIKAASFHSELDEKLQQQLRAEVVSTVQTTLEAALLEELQADLQTMGEAKPRRSGYFKRRLDTQYGRIDALAVPKLRHHNKVRQWRILERYQQSIKGFLDFAGYLYIMGLSLRDLQEALYFLLGTVLSLTAINRVTLRVQEHMQRQRQAAIARTPAILIIDGVWVEIQYPTGMFKLDQAGHERQCREAQERVILSVMAVWPDGSYELLHYEIATSEDEAAGTV